MKSVIGSIIVAVISLIIAGSFVYIMYLRRELKEARNKIKELTGNFQINKK